MCYVPTILNQTCYYFTEDHLTAQRDHFSKSFSVLTLNAQSIHAKIEELRQLIYRLSQMNILFDAICIQESWLNENDDTFLLPLNGYKLINKTKHASAHGGLITYVLDEYKHEILFSTPKQENWECMLLKLSKPGMRDVLVGNVYRPPRMLNADLANFIEKFGECIRSANPVSCPCIIAGDFNINLLESILRPHFTEYIELLLSEGLHPLLSYPTRFSDSSSTLIDHIHLRNSGINKNQLLSGILMTHISDHQPCFASFPIKFEPKKSNENNLITITTRNENFILKVQNEISEANVMGALSGDRSVEENYELFLNYVQQAIEKNSTTKSVKPNKYNKKKSPWVTQGILISLKFRDKLYTKYKGTPRDSDQYQTLKINLKTYNRILKKTIRHAKAKHYSNIFEECKNDAKQTWKNINEILNKNSSNESLPDHIDLNGNKLSSTNEILNGLNHHFSTVGAQVANSVGPTDRRFSDYLQSRHESNFTFQTIDKLMIERVSEKELKNKNSTGPDGISSKLVKQLKNQLREPLAFFINQSITTGIFPSALKIAKVKALFKSGDPHNASNYRPISLLPAFSKIFEKVLLKQLIAYFNENSLFFGSQYGFRQGHSTEAAVVELIDRIATVMDQGKTPFSIFLDLSKAFDCLHHPILLEKLEHYGITGMALELMKNYLKDRMQCTQENLKSSKLPITTGVPQGSILGPFLFLVYMNDFSNCSTTFSTINYADDTALTSAICCFEHPPVDHINFELKKVTEWLATNKLCVNASKSKLMFFYPRNKQLLFPQIYLNDSLLERVDSFNYLGIIISRDLSWGKHIMSVSTKISKTIGIMKKLMNQLPSYVLKTIYQSLIVCRLEYGILAWGASAIKLLGLQKKAVRVIEKAKYNSHTEPIFKRLNLLRIGDLYILKVLAFYHKFCNDRLPKYFLTNYILYNEDFHNYSTRNRNSLAVPRFRHGYSHDTLRYKIVKTVNELPDYVTDKTRSHSLHGFVNYVKKFLLQKYSVSCQIPNCYICGLNN